MDIPISTKVGVVIGKDGLSIDLNRGFYLGYAMRDIKGWCNAFGDKVTTTQLAVLAKSKKSKVKRHVRELLGPDPKARQGTGYARELTEHQAVAVYIYGLLIRYMSKKEIRQTTKIVIHRFKESGEM